MKRENTEGGKMSITLITGKLLKKMVSNGSVNLKNSCEEINALNVFPVPDGDTGTNMSMTMASGVVEINNCKSSSIVDMGKSLSRGLLMGARGNSGVILSQFFRGLYVGMKNISTNSINVETFIHCLESGKAVAYKAVMEPVEGTILTVIKDATNAVVEKINEISTFNELFDLYVKAAKESEERTPDLLPVLKEAGVTDSGGAGFIKVIEGMQLAIEGKIIESVEASHDVDAANKYNYRDQFVLTVKDKENFLLQDLRQELASEGDLEIHAKENGLVEIDIYTDTPGKILELAIAYGQINDVKIENLQVEEKEEEKEPQKENAVVVVCFGDGIKNTFKELGVDYIIDGGQTMNPSTECFVKACKEVNAKNVIIVPNNGNVIMAAEQCNKLIDNINIKVLKTKTIAQGYEALMAYDATRNIDENIAEMEQAVSEVKTGEVTYAIRDTEINGIKIAVNDFMSILNGNIIASVKERVEAAKVLLKETITDETSVVTVFAGKGVEESESAELEDYCRELSEDVEVEIVQGDQDIYSYIISIL